MPDHNQHLHFLPGLHHEQILLPGKLPEQLPDKHDLNQSDLHRLRLYMPHLLRSRDKLRDLCRLTSPLRHLMRCDLSHWVIQVRHELPFLRWLVRVLLGWYECGLYYLCFGALFLGGQVPGLSEWI